MSRRKRKKNNSDYQEAGPFVRLSHEMQDSPAWKDLTDKAKLAYLNIRRRHDGSNAKDIECPFSTLVNKMAQATWARSTRELAEHGFITLEEESKGLGHKPNKYGLCSTWKLWGTERFKNFVKPINYQKDPNKGFSKLWREDPKRMIKIRKDRAKKKK